MATQQFYLNGYKYSHSSLEITVQRENGSSEIFVDVDSIEYSDALEIELVRGTNRGMIGWTAGDYEAADSVLSMGKSSFQIGIVRNLGDGWMGSDIQVTISYNDRNQPLTRDVLKGRILSAADSSAAGPANVRTKMGIKTAYIMRDGFMPLQGMVR
jgi:hypothetical protein